jgi:hypothetical protein
MYYLAREGLAAGERDAELLEDCECFWSVYGRMTNLANCLVNRFCDGKLQPIKIQGSH